MAMMDQKRLARYNTEMGSDAASFIKIPFFKLGAGTTKVRVLPGQEPGSIDKDFYVLVYLHYKVSPTKPTVPVVCARTKDPRQKCPICDYIAELKASGDEGDKITAEEMAPRMKYVLGIMPLEGEDRGKQMVYMAPKKIWQKIIQLGTDEEYGDVTHPYEGFDLKFIKSGTGKKGTEYDCTPVRNPSPIASDPAEVEEILANQFDLWRFRVVPSAEEVIGFMNGDIDRFTTDGFSGANAMSATSPPAAKKKVYTPTMEEPEEEAPAPRVRKPVQVVEEEEEAEQLEEEEEAPAPVRRAAPPTSDVSKKLDAVRARLSGK